MENLNSLLKFWVWESGRKIDPATGVSSSAGEIALWSATNVSIPCFLVLSGSESSFTEITEYIYFSLILTRVEFTYKID